MIFNVITLFPQMFGALTENGVVGRAFSKGLVELDFTNPRVFTEDVHKTVDDRPYGGGPGMVMMAEPLMRSIEWAVEKVATQLSDRRSAQVSTSKAVRPKVVYMSPQGVPLTQAKVAQLAQEPGLVVLAGRYEGVDERVIELAVDEEISIGDYVLSGGELPAMVMLDAIIRLLPGVLGHSDSAAEDSFASGLLDCPHYTRPEEFRGKRVPDVLLSGHHANIEQWRLQQSLGRTFQRRPDLMQNLQLTEQQQALLKAYLKENR